MREIVIRKWQGVTEKWGEGEGKSIRKKRPVTSEGEREREREDEKEQGRDNGKRKWDIMKYKFMSCFY